MLTYQRHIIRAVLPSVLTVVLTMVGFILFIQLIKFAYLLNRGVTLQSFLSLAFLMLPYLFFIVLPFALCAGVVVGYNKLGGDRELLALNNAGLGPIDVSKPAIFLALLFMLCTYCLAIYLMPISYSMLKIRLNDLRESFALHLVEERVFTQLSKNVVIYAEGVHRDGTLGGVIVFDNRASDASILFAQSGIVSTKLDTPSIELYNGVRQSVGENHEMTEMRFGVLSVSLHPPRCADNQKSNGTCSNAAKSYSRSLQELFVTELLNSDDLKLRAEGHQRITWPLYGLALTMVALSMLLHTPYRRRSNDKTLVKIFVTILLILAVHFSANNAASRYAIFNAVSYFNVVFCFVFSYFLYMKNA